MISINEGIITEDLRCVKCRKVHKHVTYDINLGRAPYLSKLDGSDIYFKLCDDCLVELIHSFPEDSRDEIINSGSNISYYNGNYFEDEKAE